MSARTTGRNLLRCMSPHVGPQAKSQHVRCHVSCRGQCRPVGLDMSFVARDPEQSSAAIFANDVDIDQQLKKCIVASLKATL